MRRFLLSLLCAIALSATTLPAQLAGLVDASDVPRGAAYADPTLHCNDGTQPPNNDLTKCSATAQSSSTTFANGGTCGAGKVEIGVPLVAKNNCIENSSATGGAVVAYLRLILQFLSGGIGIVVVLMMVIGGMQYITSAGEPARIKAAKDRITNALTALLLFVMGFAILSFVVPGGIL
jgi:hypothetical protein